MKHCLTGFFLASLIVGAGCSKSSTQRPAPFEIQGVKVDVPKLQEAFGNTAEPLQAMVAEVSSGLRYGQYSQSLAALSKLANSPGVTDAQKQVIADVVAQVKQLAARAPSTPGQ